MAAFTAVSLLALALVLSLSPSVHAVTCRQGPLAASQYCALPYALGNFQGYYRCASDVEVARPSNKTELLEVVRSYKRVKGVGTGHSWWKEQFCAGNDSDAVGVVTTEMVNTLAEIEQPTYAKQSAPSFPIQVDEDRQIVTVQAGVTQRILLNYLANYTSDRAPYGYVLPALAWYVDQTVGGAVSTGTHGSTMQWGSLSSQATRIELALANGTLMEFTPTSNTHLWKAVQLGVGRLGIVTEVDFMILRQRMITRTVTPQSFWEFVDWTQALQDGYNRALASGSDAAISAALSPIDMTQLFWFVGSNETWLITYNHTELSRRFVDPTQWQNLPVAAQSTGGRRHLLEEVRLADVFAQAPTPTLGPKEYLAMNPASFAATSKLFLSDFLPNGTFTERDAILNENELVNKLNSDYDPYDQYEVSVRLETAGDCVRKMGEAMYAEDLLGGFVVPPLIRFVNGELAYLANANGGPRMYFNIEDHLSKSTGVDNTKLQRVLQIFREQCGARMHWGKAGWPRWSACFDGATEYPDSWCYFGCAVQELDPSGKFQSISDVWVWNATNKAGQTVPLKQCCTPQGFSSDCTCQHRAPCRT